MEHSRYDKRGYPIVDVREGYGEWVRTYEQTVQDEMDLRLLERLETADWAGARRVLDLACGTGRIGAWLRGRCPGAVDGVDITPEMLEVASRKGVYRTLAVADVTARGCRPGRTICASSRSRTSTCPICGRSTRRWRASPRRAAAS
jgi:SAM-dependent methyltransferase